MAKKRSRKKSSKCPEPFNTLIDLAAAATMDYISYKRRQKNGCKRNKIDPYAAAGVAMGLGKLNNTEDVIMLGGLLGAMGAFDENSVSPAPSYRPLDNRYAWRLNCEDGSDYGLNPRDYETRTEYHDALHRMKYAWRYNCEDGSVYGLDPKRFSEQSDYEEALRIARLHEATPPETSAQSDYVDGSGIDQQPHKSNEQNIHQPVHRNVDDLETLIFCRVSSDGIERYYLTEDTSIRKGDYVVIPIGNAATSTGKVCSIERHMRLLAPQPVEETPVIIGKA